MGAVLFALAALALNHQPPARTVESLYRFLGVRIVMAACGTASGALMASGGWWWAGVPLALYWAAVMARSVCDYLKFDKVARQILMG